MDMIDGTAVPGLDVRHPGDAGFDEARTVWNAMVDHRPALVVRCRRADDVVAALALARREGLEVGVRCGGHSVVGHGVPDGGLMIDLTPMGEVRVDPERRRAWVQGGALLGALDAATQPYGLATTAGNVSHTGVGGLTLGGGMGWLARQCGLACDNVVSYQVVTAAGEVVRASADERPELFWALRGGGGNFGVVTEFEFRLHDVGTRALGVELDLPVGGAAPVLARWRDLAVRAPRAATYTAGVHDGLVTLGFVWVGDPRAGRAHAAEFGAGLEAGPGAPGAPVTRRVEELSYLDLQTREDSTAGHAVRRYWKGHYVRELSLGAIEALLATEPGVRAGLQAYGGAVADVPDGDAAFSQRDTRFEYVAATGWTDPAEDAARIAATRASAARVAPFASGAYVNALGDDGAAGVGRAYPPEKLARLAAVKAVYDPDNVFHLNQNIPPAAVTPAR
ncbi:FAD-binding oxidoreductase [Promicromonospora iranensis]|uniref:FAD/FMN-containing dehydrogenase n=1 Tax=Promicromonospora iranensis TaxID=1105144 RepID=A0ABU2CIK6_9MICO|nr:FAD-binding oxidoreductase [Promicromonospora iranensis]MDR7381047.1 FAD/FMN-containing dehydrogenase [Promicromonospora iranensis]